jgi:hypothetical protein
VEKARTGDAAGADERYRRYMTGAAPSAGGACTISLRYCFVNESSCAILPNCRHNGATILNSILSQPHWNTAMPLYQIWYNDADQPLVVNTPYRLRDIEIAGEIIRNEQRQNRQSADPAGLTVRELLRVNGLRNVRYTLDESEPVDLR